MKLRQLLQALPFAALLATSAAVVTLPSCSSKNDSPVLPEIKGVELKCEFSIEAGAPVNLSWVASTGGTPNIYRDGKLVAQSVYNERNADKAIKKLQTTFTHQGLAFVIGFVATRPESANQPAEIPVRLVARLYRQGTLVQTYVKELKLTDYSVSDQVSLSAF